MKGIQSVRQLCRITGGIVTLSLGLSGFSQAACLPAGHYQVSPMVTDGVKNSLGELFGSGGPVKSIVLENKDNKQILLVSDKKIKITPMSKATAKLYGDIQQELLNTPQNKVEKCGIRIADQDVYMVKADASNLAQSGAAEPGIFLPLFQSSVSPENLTRMASQHYFLSFTITSKTPTGGVFLIPLDKID